MYRIQLDFNPEPWHLVVLKKGWPMITFTLLEGDPPVVEIVGTIQNIVRFLRVEYCTNDNEVDEILVDLQKV